MQVLTAIAAAALVALMTGCARQPVSAPAPAQILGTRWQLVELRGQPLPELRRPPHILLEAEGNRVTGFGGCNSIGGAFTLDEAAMRIRFGEMMSTLMACAEGMETEQAFNEVLGMVDNYSLNGEQLTLNRARMAPLARFEAVSTSPPARQPDRNR
jgi:heat shock protein HslJ